LIDLCCDANGSGLKQRVLPALLRAVKHPFGDTQKKYEFFFCNGQYRRMNGKEVWDASGSSNLNELHAHTSSHIFRKTKDECMSDELHPKKREYIKVSVG
jgi:hypothetical protein